MACSGRRYAPPLMPSVRTRDLKGKERIPLMIKPYRFYFDVVSEPSGSFRVRSADQPQLFLHETTSEKRAIDYAIGYFSLLVKVYTGLENSRVDLAPFIRKTSVGNYEMIFEVDLDWRDEILEATSKRWWQFWK